MILKDVKINSRFSIHLPLKDGSIRLFIDGKEISIPKEGIILVHTNFCPPEIKKEIFLKRETSGWYNVFLIKKGRVEIFNDEMGLYPLYYIRKGNTMIFSSSMGEILSHTHAEIDEISLAQTVLFNFPLGERTLFKGVKRFLPGSNWVISDRKITKKIYKDWVKTLNQPFYFYSQAIKFLKEVLQEVIEAAIQKKRDIGLLLSDGYDSRIILAILKNLGVRGKAFTWEGNGYRDTEIPRKLSKIAGFQYVPLSFGVKQKEDLPSLLKEFLDISHGDLPLTRLNTFIILKGLSWLDVLLWGEGEFIRPPSLPSEPITEKALHLLQGKNFQNIEGFFVNLPFFDAWEDAKKEIERRIPWEIPIIKRLTLYLLYEGYRKTYGNMMAVFSKLLPISMPLMSAKFIDIILKTPYSIARLKDWKPSLERILHRRKLYYEILKEIDYEFLKVPTNRGYPPLWDRSFLGYFMMSLYGIKKMFKEKIRIKKSHSLFQKFLINYFIKRPLVKYINKKRIKEICKEKKIFTSFVEYDLSKAALIDMLVKKGVL